MDSTGGGNMADGTRHNYWKRVVALLFLGWLVIWVYRTILTPVFDEIQLTVGPQSGTAMGLISSCYFFGYVATQIPGGMLMDRVGKKAVLIPGFLLFGAGILVVGAARSLGGLYAGSVLAGVGTGTYYSGAFSLSGQHLPAQNRFLATAVINNGCAVGMVIGLVGSSVLVKQAGLPWQWVVYGAAALAFGMVPVLAGVLKNDRPAPAEKPAGEKPKLFSARHLATYFFYFSTCYGYYMVVTWLPSFLEQERGVTGAAVGYTAAIVAVSSIPGALLFGKLLDRFRHCKIAVLTGLQLLAAGMMVLCGAVRPVPLLMLCLALYGLTGKQAVDPLIVPHVTDLSAGGPLSTGLGVFNFFGMSASVLAPFLTGLFTDLLGSRVFGFYLAAALLCASTLVFYLANRGRK